MDDSEIIELYFQRSEEAVTQTASKYGKYCYKLHITFYPAGRIPRKASTTHTSPPGIPCRPGGQIFSLPFSAS